MKSKCKLIKKKLKKYFNLEQKRKLHKTEGLAMDNVVKVSFIKQKIRTWSVY